jgi:hypothetical protein
MEGSSGAVWTHEVVTDHVVTFRLGRVGASRVAEWPGLATLTCRNDGTGVSLVPVAGANPVAVEKLRRGHVQALVGALAGRLALHASAVGWRGGAVLFLGRSGSGKSTAAAELCIRGGGELLADDVAMLDADAVPVTAQPTEDDHWLTGPSRAVLGVQAGASPFADTKVALRALRLASAPVPLALIVALRFTEQSVRPSVRALSGVSAAYPVLEAILRFDVDEGSARRREIEQMSRVHDSAPMIELVRNAAQPGSVVEVVEQALAGPGGTW